MRKFVINVNGNSYEVEVEEVGVDSKAKAMPKAAPAAPVAPAAPAAPKAPAKEEPKKVVQASEGQETVEAPMPGNIWKILVSEGQEVNEGDVLLILEAMKMENEIVAPRSGKVVAINTSEGTAVGAGDKLVVIE